MSGCAFLQGWEVATLNTTSVSTSSALFGNEV